MKYSLQAKKMLLNLRLYTAFFVIGVCVTGAEAQIPDTMTVLKEFVQISNGYKKIPLHVSVEIRSGSNFVLSEQDTAVMHAEFYLQDSNAYVRFGELEQVVDRSVAILVSDKLQQIVLYKDVAPVISRLKSMMGAALPDSSIRNMAARYSVLEKTGTPGKVLILLSRSMIYGTKFPKEEIELSYDPLLQYPKRITTTNRTLLKLDDERYNEMKKKADLRDKLISINEEYYLVREQWSLYEYKKVDDSPLIRVPVITTDRVVHLQDGSYRPADKYTAYRLIEH